MIPEHRIPEHVTPASHKTARENQTTQRRSKSKEAKTKLIAVQFALSISNTEAAMNDPRTPYP
jgi:hypothetical protein